MITDKAITADNAKHFAGCNRARWKIENGHNNVLKNHGYNLEHNFGHEEERANEIYCVLNFPAFLMHGVMHLLYEDYQKVLTSFGDGGKRFSERCDSPSAVSFTKVGKILCSLSSAMSLTAKCKIAGENGQALARSGAARYVGGMNNAQVNITNLAFKDDGARAFTYADYRSWELREGERFELIDGAAYALAAPGDAHQGIVTMLAALFFDFLRGKPCKVRVAPYDVRLFYEADGSDSTVVQPDLTVVCDEAKRGPEGCRGAPDMAAEVLSPANTAVEMLRKMELYRRAGVREGLEIPLPELFAD